MNEFIYSGQNDVNKALMRWVRNM